MCECEPPILALSGYEFNGYWVVASSAVNHRAVRGRVIGVTGERLEGIMKGKCVDHPIIQSTRRWIHEVVVDLNLCPFAQRELHRDTVRYRVYGGSVPEELLTALYEEITTLDDCPEVETCLVIHPNVLRDFVDFNDFLETCQHLLASMDRVGVYQIASFHPDYQFAGTQPDDAENYTNRSPYPMLHVLREASVEQAVATHPNASAIPEHNIARLEALGAAAMADKLARCFVGDL